MRGHWESNLTFNLILPSIPSFPRFHLQIALCLVLMKQLSCCSCRRLMIKARTIEQSGNYWVGCKRPLRETNNGCSPPPPLMQNHDLYFSTPINPPQAHLFPNFQFFFPESFFLYPSCQPHESSLTPHPLFGQASLCFICSSSSTSLDFVKTTIPRT